MSRRFVTLARSQRGAAVIELALVAPVLATLVIGVVDISMAYGHKLELEQAAQRAMEKVMQTTGSDTAEATVKKEAVCQINGANSDGTCKTGRITTADVKVTYLLECNGVAQSYETDCAAGQTEVRYVEAEVSEVYQPSFPIPFVGLEDGKWHLSATAGVRVQ
jgi:Flp pilus assembly protein TadG